MAQPARKTKLKAAPDTSEVSVGTESLPIAADGTVEVPNEAVESLTGLAGFTLADIEIAPPPEGHVEVDPPDADATLSFGGQTFARGEDGRFFVPLAAAPDLEAHGFRIVSLAEVAARAATALAALADAPEPSAPPADTAPPSAPAPDPTPAEGAGETPAA